MQEGMWRVLQYSRRKADRYSHGSGGSRYCKSGEGSWTSQLPQSSPPQILVYSIYTNTQGRTKKKREREAWMRNKSDKACFLSRPIKKKEKETGLTAMEQKGKGDRRLTKLAGLQVEVYSPTNQRLCLHQSSHILAWHRTRQTSVVTCYLYTCVCVLSCPQLAGRGL